MNEYRNLVKLWDSLSPKLYYATFEDVELDTVIMVHPTWTHPKYFICHPDSLEYIRQNIVGRRLVHIKDYVPA